MDAQGRESRSWRSVGLLGIAAMLAACSLKAVTFTPDGTQGSDAGPSVGLPGQGSDAGPAAATCSDGIQNGDETDRDCGGSCGPCAVGLACSAGADCTSRSCQAAVCRAPSCSDGIQNGDETDRDCGGSCGACAVGLACAGSADCSSRSCQDALCRDPSCSDGIQNGDETDRDCGGSCGGCADGATCLAADNCQSRVCTNSSCQVATCTDQVQNGAETSTDCGGSCAGCGIGISCGVDGDCLAGGICDAQVCRFARSCAELQQHRPGSPDGVYSIAPAGVPFAAVCDVARGGWTLLLKANGDPTLGYGAVFWTDTNLLDPTDLTTGPGNAKYQSFLDLPITTLLGDLDGFRYTQAFPLPITAHDIFSNGPSYVMGYPTFNTGAPNWATQPNCQIFGVDTDKGFGLTRFGWSANQEDDCTSNDTAIGFGLQNNAVASRGAGYECLAGGCVPDIIVNQPGNGLLWGR
jgi:hypothetical protein